MTIGERAYKAISGHANQKGVGIVEYAKSIGISQPNLSHWKSAHSEPRAYLLSLMAEAGLDVHWILTGQEAGLDVHWILTGQEAGKVDVVRCEECKKRYTPDCIMSDGLGEAGDNDFCSYGERKGDNAGA